MSLSKPSGKMFRRKGTFKKSLVSRVSRVEKRLKTVQETKMYQYPANGIYNSFGTTSLDIALGAFIEQGTNYNQRIGAQIHPKRVNLRMGFLPPSVGVIANVLIRVAVVRTVAGLTGASGTISLEGSTSPTAVQDITCVYYDKHHEVSFSGGFPTVLNVTIPIKGYEQRYNSPGLGASSNEDIYVCFVASVANVVCSGLIEMFYEG